MFGLYETKQYNEIVRKWGVYMNQREPDRRTLKSRQFIHEALFSLMQEKAYNKITIQDIIDRANVGRSTFYAHFEDKEALLLSSIEHLFSALKQYVKSYTELGDTRLIPIVELFEHIKENSRLIKGLLKAKSAELFFEKAQAYWNQEIKEYLYSRLPEGSEPKVPVEILTNHISSTLIFLLKWWVSNKMSYTPQQMDRYFQELINPCIDSIVRNASKGEKP